LKVAASSSREHQRIALEKTALNWLFKILLNLGFGNADESFVVLRVATNQRIGAMILRRCFRIGKT
jgi:hypothetical protein